MAQDPILKKLQEGQPKRSAPRGRSMRLPSSKPMMSRGGRGGKGAPAPKGGGGLGIRPTSAFWIGRALMRDKDREESMILGGQGRQLLETGRAGEFGRMSQQYDQAIQTLDDMLEGGMEP